MSSCQSGRTLFHGGTVLTLDPALGDFAEGDALVEGARIAGAGHGLKAGDANIAGASDAILLQGLVDVR